MRPRNVIRSRWFGGMVFLSCAAMLLTVSGCDHSAAQVDAPDFVAKNALQAQQWLILQKQKATAYAAADEGATQTEQLDGRLMRVDALSGAATFTTVNDTANLDRTRADAVSVQASDDNRKTTAVRSERVNNAVPSTRTLMPAPVPNPTETIVASEPSVATEPTAAPDLSHADANQIHYLGLLRTDEAQRGWVKVGERVYQVALNDRIGKGRWPVVQLDGARMQLRVNGRVKNYLK